MSGEEEEETNDGFVSSIRRTWLSSSGGRLRLLGRHRRLHLLLHPQHLPGAARQVQKGFEHKKVANFTFYSDEILAEEVEEEEEQEEDVGANPTSSSSDSLIDFDVVRFVLKSVDIVTIIYFTMEYTVRFACAPRKVKFFFQVIVRRRK